MFNWFQEGKSTEQLQKEFKEYSANLSPEQQQKELEEKIAKSNYPDDVKALFNNAFNLKK